MNATDTQRFKDLYGRFEAGDRKRALRELRDWAGRLDDPWDRAELVYHEIMFLLEMNEIPEARRQLGRLTSAIESLTAPPVDGYEVDIRISLPIMARYAEMKVTIAEGKDQDGFRLLEDLVSRYPKQLSTPDFRTISDEIRARRGFLLADAGRWAEAKPFLEAASPPDSWKGIPCYYLGYCYYTSGEYERARNKLAESFDRGLEGHWKRKAHFLLGIVEYRLSHIEAAKREFEMCVKTADQKYLDTINIWEWLEAAARDLGLQAEAENYRKLRVNSPSKSRPN